MGNHLTKLPIPNNPQKYLIRLGNHSKIQDALDIASRSEHYTPYRAADFLRRLSLMLWSNYRPHFFDSIDVNMFVSWLLDPPISSTLFLILNSVGLLPTPEILRFIEGFREEEEIRSSSCSY